jgi:hypothetical protein
MPWLTTICQPCNFVSDGIVDAEARTPLPVAGLRRSGDDFALSAFPTLHQRQPIVAGHVHGER